MKNTISAISAKLFRQTRFSLHLMVVVLFMTTFASQCGDSSRSALGQADALRQAMLRQDEAALEGLLMTGEQFEQSLKISNLTPAMQDSIMERITPEMLNSVRGGWKRQLLGTGEELLAKPDLVWAKKKDVSVEILLEDGVEVAEVKWPFSSGEEAYQLVISGLLHSPAGWYMMGSRAEVEAL